MSFFKNKTASIDLTASSNYYHKKKPHMPFFQAQSLLNSPKNSTKSSYYDDIENILKQIDPDFKLSRLEKSPDKQTLNCLKQATKAILEHKDYINSGNYASLIDTNSLSTDQFKCENCHQVSLNISNQYKNIIQLHKNLDKKIKIFERIKFIQIEKNREEKNIIITAKQKLDNLTSSLIQKKKEILKQNKDCLIQNFEIETQDNISVCTSRSNPNLPLKLESFNIFQLENNLDFSSFIDELEIQIELYNKEISIKESYLDQREKALIYQESQLKTHLNDFEFMVLSLESSKKEFLDFKLETFPSLETQSEILNHLIQDLNNKKEELNAYVQELQSKHIKFQAYPSKSLESNLDCKETQDFAEYLLELQNKIHKYYEKKTLELKASEDRLMKLEENTNHTLEMINYKEKKLYAISEIIKEKEKKLELKSNAVSCCKCIDKDYITTPRHCAKRKSMSTYSETVL
jgi:hypothetical protein